MRSPGWELPPRSCVRSPFASVGSVRTRLTPILLNLSLIVPCFRFSKFQTPIFIGRNVGRAPCGLAKGEHRALADLSRAFRVRGPTVCPGGARFLPAGSLRVRGFSPLFLAAEAQVEAAAAGALPCS